MRDETPLDMDFRDIHSPQDLVERSPLERRDFLKVVGGGIIVLFTVSDMEAAERRRRGGGGFGQRLPSDFNAFLRVGADGRVACFTGKIEMGQGVMTSLAQMLAEELDVALASVDMVMGDTDLCPWDMGTFGSMTTRFFGPPLRAAAAEARKVLLELAAERLKVPAGRLQAKDGAIHVSGQPATRVTYAALTEGKRIERHIGSEPPLKEPAGFTIVGSPAHRLDGRDKVTGKAVYAGDVRLPGMLCAKILRPPAHGARLVSADVAAAEKIEGVQVVRDGDLIAILHERPDEAGRALDEVKARYSRPEPKVDETTIFDHLLGAAPPGRRAAGGGDLRRGETLATTVVEKKYLNSYVAHAPMEPHTAVASFEGGKMTVWASTQAPFRARDEVARAIGIPSNRVRVITPFVGGGFGGKVMNRQAVEAARLAKLTGKPVQVAWSRAEEFFHDSFRPAAIVTIKSGITGEGKIVLWDYHVYWAGERGSQQFYDIPNHSTVSHGGGYGGGPDAHPFATGAWRAPGNNTNTFARESQIDILAVQAGMDPVEFRRKNLSDARLRGVLDAAAKKFGWTPGTAPSRRGYGVALGTDAGTSVATMVEAAVNRDTGEVQVKRVVAAQDMGLVINPEGARTQMEGCITMGLGYALREEVRFRGGEILDVNFDTYHIPRFSWLPKIETVLIDAGDAPPQGGGEPAIITMGAAVANAIHDATGARLLQLPMTPERVKAAMGKV